MVRFEDLQSLWQKQPERLASPQQAIELTSAFRRYGRRSDLINCAKILLLSINLTFVVTRLRHRPTMLFGVCLAIFSALHFLIHDWRAQRAIARLNFAEPSVAFLRKALARLEEQRDPFRNSAFYIAIGGMWVGIAFMLLAAWNKLSATERILCPASVALAPYAIYRFGRVVRRKRFQLECQPLIDRLSAALKTIEEGRA